MKKWFLFLLFPCIVYANEIQPKSVIKEVTVFLQGAQITSEVKVNLQAGSSKVLIKDLSPNIDPNSIQVNGLQNVTIGSINYYTNFIEKKPESEKINSFQSELERLSRALAVLRNKVKGLEDEEALLNANRKINTEQQNVTVERLSAYSKYYRERIAELRTETYDLNRSIEKLNKSITDINQELNQLRSNNTERRGEILLDLESPSSVSLTLILKYNVSKAGWFPIYDIKATNTESPVAIHYKANVYQDTGENWNNVNITLSTGNPTLNTEKPEVNPHYLNFVNPHTYTPQRRSRNTANYTYNPTVRRVTGVITDDIGLPLPGVNVLLKGASRGTQTDFDGRYTIDVAGAQEIVYSYLGFETETLPVYASQMNLSLLADTQSLDEVVVTGYANNRALRGKAAGISVVNAADIEQPVMIREENVTNVLFKISRKYSITTSPSEVTTIEINTFNVLTDYEYYAAPLLVQNVYLTAKLKGWESFDLLPGEAKVYFAGSFAGNTYINPQQTEEELVLSLGVDPTLVVERKQINDLKDRSFFGNTRIIKRNYEINIRNNKNSSVDITLLDRIPISQNREIKVESLSYGNASFDDKTGVVTWKVNLPAKGSEKSNISYEVKYPRDKFINLD